MVTELIIAVLALVVSVYSIYATIKHNKLSVRPLIEGHRNAEIDNGLFEFYLNNKGLGPAIIKKYYFFVDKTLDSNITTCEEFFSEIRAQGKFVFRVKESSVTHKSIDSALRSGESERMFMMRIEPTSNNEAAIKLIHSDTLNVIERFSLAIEYQSIYGKKFRYDPDRLLNK